MNKKELNKYLFNGRSTYLNGSISAWRLQIVNPTKDGFTRKSFGWTGRKPTNTPKDVNDISPNTGRETIAKEFLLEAVASGIVVENLVEPEELINEGQALLKFKTLNLELLIPSPVTGIISELNYETGSKVEKGSCLVTISPNV
jgi:biotin carboxyl carrier protein